MSTRRFAISIHALAAVAVLWIAVGGSAFARPVLGQTIVSKQVEDCQPGEFCVGKGAEWAVPLCPGGNIAYSVKVENLTTLTGTAQILDPIPAGTTFVQGSASNGATYDAANDRIVWEGPLPPGQSWTIGFSVTVDPEVPSPSTITNVATGTLFAGETTLQAQAQGDIQVDCPPLAFAVDKTAEFAQPLQCPGGNVFWTVRFTNLTDRPRTLTAAVDDLVLAGMTFAGSLTEGCAYDPGTRRVTCNDIPIGPGQTKSIGFSTTVDAGASPGDTFTNTATVTLSDPLVGDSLEKQAEEAVTCPLPPLDLEVEKTAELAEPLECPGGNIFWTVRFTNLTDRPRTLSAAVDDLVPAGMTFAGSLTEGCAYDPGTRQVTCNDIPIGPGQTKSIGFSTTVDAGASPGDTFTNTATVTLSDPVEQDSVQAQASETVACPLPPLDLEVEKTAEFAEPLECPGGNVFWQVRMTNNTERDGGMDISLRDPIPDGTTFAGSLSGGAVHDAANDRVTWDGILGPGDTRTVGFSVTVDETGGTITNTATVTLTDPQTQESVQEQAQATAACPGEPADGRRPLILIPGMMGTKIVATKPFLYLGTSDVYEFARDEEVFGNFAAARSEQERYLALQMKPNGTPKYPTGLPDGARGPRYLLNVIPWIDEVAAGVGPVTPMYKPFRQFFENNGYELGSDLFIFGWDWRMGAGWINPATGNYLNVERLDAFINQILSLQEHEEFSSVDIVAHSHGGLLSWLYVSQHDSKVQNLITIGTPYFGSPKAVASMLWGVTYGMQIPGLGPVGLGAEVVREMSRYMVGVAELLPSDRFPRGYFQYRNPAERDLPTGVLTNAQVRTYIKNQRDNANTVVAGVRFQNALEAVLRNGPRYRTSITIIAGSGLHSWGRLESDGEEGRVLGTYNGDETVPYVSHHAGGVIPGTIPRYYTRQQEHLKSVHPFDGWQDGTALAVVRNILNGAPPLDRIGPTQARSFIPFAPPTCLPTVKIFPWTCHRVAIKSPLHLLVEDEEGRLAGIDPADENLVHLGIPGSQVFALGTGENELVILPDEGDFKLHLQSFATGNETFDLAIETVGEDSSTEEIVVFSEVSITPESAGVLEWRGGRASTLRMDDDGDGTFEREVQGLVSSVDMDGDGLLDGVETFYWGTDPALADTDGDGFDDSGEILELFSDPLDPDDPLAAPPAEYPWLTSPDLPGFEAKVRITPQGAEPLAGDAELLCIVESLCVSGALPGRPEVFVKVIGPRPNGKLWTQISRFTPSEVEVWLRQIATGTIRYYRLDPVGPASDDVSGLQDREAFDPAGAPSSAPRGALLPGAAVEPLPLDSRIAAIGPRLEPGEPEPPAGLDWLTTPELPGFRFKALITPAGGSGVGGQGVDRCIPETLCIQGALAGRPEVFAKIIGPRPNGFLWVQAARFTPSRVELWVEQEGTGTVGYYRLEPVGPGVDDVSGLQDREAFTPSP